MPGSEFPNAPPTRTGRRERWALPTRVLVQGRQHAPGTIYVFACHVRDAAKGLSLGFGVDGLRERFIV